jgi:uncharacterized protein (TIGR02145 family)
MTGNATRLFCLAVIASALCLCSPNNSGNGDRIPPPVTITDIDGNVYHTVTIGNQVWMAENLQTTRFNDGTAIPPVSGDSAWAADTAPGYCWYGGDSAAGRATWGALYNWYSVNAGKLAPAGWHVATDTEWSILMDVLGDSVAGGELKDTGTSLWSSPNAGATDQTGFSALPAGYRAYDGVFQSGGMYGYWWSATANGAGLAWYRYVGYNYASANRSYTDMNSGFSVRCVRN